MSTGLIKIERKLSSGLEIERNFDVSADRVAVPSDSQFGISNSCGLNRIEASRSA